MDGSQCPANKLVITPSAPIKDGASFTVTVYYTGRPGVHNDGDGTTEGWFRAPDGGFVTTEPVASEDWMPLNDYPTAKPTYDFYNTVTAGRTVIANGELVSVQRHPARRRVPRRFGDLELARRHPIASYLVEDSVGNYSLTSAGRVDGIMFYQAQDTSIRGAAEEEPGHHGPAAEHHRRSRASSTGPSRSPPTGWSSAPRPPVSKKRCRR